MSATERKTVLVLLREATFTLGLPDNNTPNDAFDLADMRAAQTDLAKTVAELRSVEREMRERLMRSGSPSPTLIAWADRIASATGRLA